MKGLLVALLILITAAVALLSPWPEDVTFASGDETIEATLYRPFGSGPFPAVVLLHGCSGRLDKHTFWARQLVKWGYAALLVDSFTPRGIERLCSASDEDWSRFGDDAASDAEAARAFLADRDKIDAENVGLIGWSFGATTILRVIGEPDTDFEAAIAVYPSCWQHLQRMANESRYRPSAPLLILTGTADDWTRVEYCRTLLDRTVNGDGALTLREYAGARHDFDNPNQPLETLRGVRIEVDEEANDDSAETVKTGDVTIGYNREAHVAAMRDVRKFFAGRLAND